jgi:hypothetical protein
MPIDAIGTLGYVGDSNGNDLIELRRKGPVGKNSLAEAFKGGLLIRRQFAAFVGDLGRPMRIDRAHRGFSSLDTRLLTNFPFCSLHER